MKNSPTHNPNRIGRRWRVTGQVQGVGFRPFVYRIAVECGLTGTVLNDPGGVTIEGWGSGERLDRFHGRLLGELPALARIDGCEVQPISGPSPHATFRIVASDHTPGVRGRVTVDSAVCADCLREMRDPADRRFGHALINCTNCGPRYSIVRDLPYDRPLTTMAGFAMCAACACEYGDPADRRFHAQPTCCPECGPRLKLIELDHAHDASSQRGVKEDGLASITARAQARGSEGECADARLIARSVELLREGKILAIKGLGGYHLACDAGSEAAVAELRRRKRRDHKPLAVMAAGLDEARALVRLSDEAAELMCSPASPIVLGERRADAPVAPSVAPGSHRLGVMLASTPIQHLLFDQGLGPLVMTSANMSDDPLVTDDGDARARLAGVCDAILLHDRPIERAVDDSIVLDVHSRIGLDAEDGSRDGCDAEEDSRDGGVSGRDSRDGCPTGTMMLRRARGFVPEFVALPVEPRRPGLCVGADLKNTVALVRAGGAVLSQHIGDLTYSLAYERFVRTIEDLGRLFDTTPEWVACDLHPGYVSTRFAKRYARQRGIDLIEVQHHHAHLAALLGEHGRTDRIIGLVCDGVGYGTDGSAWGGEVLVGDLLGFERVGRLRPLRLPGGDAAAKETGRCALSWMDDLLGAGAAQHPAAARVVPDEARRAMILDMLGRDLNCPQSSGAGRLFDAAAAVLGLCDFNHHEAMSGQVMESAAYFAEERASGEGLVELVEGGEHGRDKRATRVGREELFELDHRALLGRLFDGIRRGEDVGSLAWLFHDALGAGLAAAAVRAVEMTGVRAVGLSGGVFCNELLTRLVCARLKDEKIQVITHQKTTPNDGAIACGQASIVSAMTPLR